MTLNTMSILCDHTSFLLLCTQHFFHTDSPAFTEVDEGLSREKTERKENNVFQQWSEFAGIDLELLWLRQGHCVFELLRLCISVSSRARKHLQIQDFMWKQLMECFSVSNSKHLKKFRF